MSECLTLEDETPDGKQVEIDLINQIIKIQVELMRDLENLDTFLNKYVITIFPPQQEKKKQDKFVNLLKEKFEKYEIENLILNEKQKKEERVKEKFSEKKEKNQIKLIFNFKDMKINFFKEREDKKKFYNYDLFVPVIFYKREILRRTINQLENFKLTVIQRLKQLVLKKNDQKKGELYQKSSKILLVLNYAFQTIFLARTLEKLLASPNLFRFYDFHYAPFQDMQNKEQYKEIFDFFEKKVCKILKKPDDKNLIFDQEIQMLIFFNMFSAIFELLLFRKLNEKEFLESSIRYDFIIQPIFKLENKFYLNKFIFNDLKDSYNIFQLNLKKKKENMENMFEYPTFKLLDLYKIFFKLEDKQQLNEIYDILLIDTSQELRDSLKQIIELNEKLMKQLDLKKEIIEQNPIVMKKILENFKNLNEQYLIVKKSWNDEEGEKFSTAGIFFQLMMPFFSFLKMFHIEIKRIKEVSKEQQNITLKKQFNQLSQLNHKPYQKYKF